MYRIVFYSLLFLLPCLAQGEDKKKEKSLREQAYSKDTSTGPYPNNWQSFPPIHGKLLGTEKVLKVTAQEGESIIAVFIASWCLPCQSLIKDIKELEDKYKKRHTRFIYIFAHDTEADAIGFSKAYQLEGEKILANVQLMRTFHEPQLPSLYVSDRKTWLVWRALAAKKEDLAKVDAFLELHTAN